MPWKVEKRHGGYAVVKKGSGELVAMHNNNAGAQAQVRALYANADGGKVKKNSTAAQKRLSSAAARRASKAGGTGGNKFNPNTAKGTPSKGFMNTITAKSNSDKSIQ